MSSYHYDSWISAATSTPELFQNNLHGTKIFLRNW